MPASHRVFRTSSCLLLPLTVLSSGTARTADTVSPHSGHTGSALAAGRRFCYESSLGTWHPMGERWWGGHERVFFPPFLSGSRPDRPPFPATEMSMEVAAVQGHSCGRQTGLRLTASSLHSLAAGKSLKPLEPYFPPLLSGINGTCWRGWWTHGARPVWHEVWQGKARGNRCFCISQTYEIVHRILRDHKAQNIYKQSYSLLC